jgi:hypothetical protein
MRTSYRIYIALFAVLAVTLAGIAHSQNIVTNYCASPTNGGIVNQVAPWYCSHVDKYVVQQWQKYLPIMLLAVTFSYTIAAVLFMFGIALRNDKLRTFGMGELYEATATALIVLLFAFISSVMFGLLPGYLGVGAIDPYDATLTYLATTINSTYAVASHLFYVGALGYSYAGVSISVGIGQQNISIPPLWSLAFQYYFFWPAWVVTAFMFEAMIALYVQYYLIIFFMYAAIPVFLIPGIIFRSLIPTRNLGGMMMAMAIGFYFIMPTLYGIAYAYTSTNISSQLAQQQVALYRYGSGSGVITNALSPQSPLASTVDQLHSAFGAFWLSILFFPALIIALTYAIITQIAEILGGMAKTSGRLRALV